MPRIVLRPITVEPNLHLGKAIADAGGILSKGIEGHRKQKVEEQRAAAAVLKEKRLAEERNFAKEQAEADRQAVTDKIGQVENENLAMAQRKAIRDALASPGGALGPFGVMNPRALASGMQSSLEIKQRMDVRGEMAAKMSVPAAHRFMLDAAEEERKTAVEKGYHTELEALQDAIGSGKIDPKTGKDLSKELQGAIKDGRAPGEIHQRVVKAVELFEAAKRRSVGWQEADQKAVGIIGALEQVMQLTTNPEVRDRLKQMVADGRSEWGRTEDGPGGNPFRAKNDSQDSLHALEKILFEAQGISELPVGRTSTEANVAGAQTHKLMTDPVARQKFLESRGGSGPQPGAPREKPARKAFTGERETELARDLVRRAAQGALASGSKADRRSSMKALLKDVADTLGLDSTSPEVLAIVREELSRAYEKPKR